MSVARLDREKTLLLLIDLQMKLVPVMAEKTTLVRRAGRLVEGANVLSVPVLVTEQYPKGLGHTYEPIAQKLHGSVDIDVKTRFSAYSKKVAAFLEKIEIKSVVVAGIEAHVCVLQTVLDLLDAGYTVAVCEDAVSSRRPIDKHAAMRRMVQAGALPATVESVLFELVADADSPQFRELRGVIQSKDA